MGVVSNGSYGVQEGLIYSFPVRCAEGGKYTIVTDLKIDAHSSELMTKTENELREERDLAFSLL